MQNDKLSTYRSAQQRDDRPFFDWLEKNCVHAVSHEEVRKITNHIKKPIREIVEKE